MLHCSTPLELTAPSFLRAKHLELELENWIFCKGNVILFRKRKARELYVARTQSNVPFLFCCEVRLCSHLLDRLEQFHGGCFVMADSVTC